MQLVNPGNQHKNTGYIVLGSFVKVGDVYIITAKLMEQKSSVLKGIITEEVKSFDELDAVSKKIAEKLAGYL